MSKEPAGRRIIEVGGDGFPGHPTDLTNLAPKSFRFVPVQGTTRTPGVQLCPPEDLVSHPIPDTRKPILIEQQCLEGSSSMASHVLRQNPRRELDRKNLGRKLGPPFRRAAAGKTNSAKETGIVKDEDSLRLIEDEMIVFFRVVLPGFKHAGGSGHSEMNPEMMASSEPEHHLLAVGRRPDELTPGQLDGNLARIAPPKHSLLTAQKDRSDRLPQPRIPLTTEVLDLGKFWHDSLSSCSNCYRLDRLSEQTP